MSRIYTPASAGGSGFVLAFEAADALSGLALSGFSLALRDGADGTLLTLTAGGATFTEVGGGIYHVEAELDHANCPWGSENDSFGESFFGAITWSDPAASATMADQYIAVPSHRIDGGALYPEIATLQNALGGSGDISAWQTYQGDIETYIAAERVKRDAWLAWDGSGDGPTDGGGNNIAFPFSTAFGGAAPSGRS